MKIIKFVQGVANNIMWFVNISLGAGLLAAVGITLWYVEDDLGRKFIKKISENEVNEVKERRNAKKRI